MTVNFLMSEHRITIGSGLNSYETTGCVFNLNALIFNDLTC